MRRAFVLPFLAACGTNAVDDILPFDAGFFDATTSKDAALFGDGGPSPWDAEIDVAKFNGGGPFLCFECVCDGTLDMCVNGGGGGGMPIASDASFGDASACDPDAAPTGCTQIPVSCLPKPTCECIQPFIGGCVCSVDPTGNGFNIDCPPKP